MNQPMAFFKYDFDFINYTARRLTGAFTSPTFDLGSNLPTNRKFDTICSLPRSTPGLLRANGLPMFMLYSLAVLPLDVNSHLQPSVVISSGIWPFIRFTCQL